MRFYSDGGWSAASPGRRSCDGGCGAWEWPPLGLEVKEFAMDRDIVEGKCTPIGIPEVNEHPAAGRWLRDRCRWVLIAAPLGDERPSDSSSVSAAIVLPGKSKWAYLCRRGPSSNLFVSYRRRRRYRFAKASLIPGSPAGGRIRRACPRCNGWVFRIPRRFVDGLMNILTPVHRYRCRSPGCSWEGNLRVQQDALPHLRHRPLDGASNATLGPSTRRAIPPVDF